MTPEEKRLCVKNGVPPAAVSVLAQKLCCSFEDAIDRYVAKKRAEKEIQRLIAEERELRANVKNLKLEINAPQTVADIKKMNRNLSVQNDILFNVYGRIMCVLNKTELSASEKLEKIKQHITNSQIATFEIGATNPNLCGGAEEEE